MADTIEFTRGSPADHEFLMPADAWEAGGKLFFAAKQAIDDDNTDAAALIDHYWTDTSVTDTTETIDGVVVPMKKYACHFPGSVTDGIESGGASTLELLGEFQWVPPSGVDPLTFPPDDDKLQCIVYMDVKRKTVP